MIDAQFRSEERYSKISIAYQGKEEGRKVCGVIDEITAKYDIQPETYTCNISEGKDVVVVEYHDDTDREAGKIFEEILDVLEIKECQ